MSYRFLIETALLTHGLASLKNMDLLRNWPFSEPCLTWVDKGSVRIGTMEEFLPFRDRAAEMIRISSHTLRAACEQGKSGALTASGTMQVAAIHGIPVAVTSGMGGIGDIEREVLCPDLPAIRDIPVVLVAATPKDVVNIQATIDWFKKHNVPVYGKSSDVLTGFMIVSYPVKISGVYQGQKLIPPMLLLNPIPEEERLKDVSFAEKAIMAGKAAEARNEYYHPAANKMFDTLSGGCSSWLQYHQLIANGMWAIELTKEG